MKKICQTCGKEYRAPPSRNLYFCSSDCYDRSSSNNPKWQGGILISSGYVYIYQPEHPNATQMGYVLEHRLVMEKVLNRYLKSTEIVHHINHDKSDNRPENLILYTSHGKHTVENHATRDKSGRFVRHITT